MATRSQRKRQQEVRRQKKRLKERKKKRPDLPQSNARHCQRLAQQKPRAWDGETPADVAVFDDSVLESLSPELAGQVSAVRDALRSACELHGDDALNRVSEIPRSSPLSQWRLFVRGLVPWLSDDTEAASDAWKRLDSERRPGRIAIAMMVAHRDDLDRLSGTPSSNEATGALPSEWCSRLDNQLLYHAKLLRRVRIERAAIRVAEAAVRIPEESKELVIGPNRIKWLRNFAGEYRSTEPHLVAALERVALHRAFAQHYSDLFESAVKAFTGPRHDRRNSLLSSHYYMRFQDEHTSGQCLERYLSRDLPANKDIPESLRKAIASQVHLIEAMEMRRTAFGGMMGLFLGARGDSRAIKHRFRESVRAYPANREAYKQHADWIESQLDNEYLTKAERTPIENQLARVMKSWAYGLPEDVEPRLWLVDYLLENEELEKAKPHVDWLASARQEDPRVRATPWKWQLLEAMRLSRRKAWLSQVPARLEEAESLWPSWLSKQWLPYLKAAWLLRCGKTDEFKQHRQQTCDESGIARESLADACMMLGAAQRMRVSAADLKPLRVPVDLAVKNIGQLPFDELLTTCSFFWDLHRTHLQYPAFRMHGRKFVMEFESRLDNGPGLVVNHVDDEQIQAAVFVCTEHRVWDDGYRLRLPAWFLTPAVQRQPMFVAAHLNSFLKLRFNSRKKRAAEMGSVLRQAAPSQRDPYYRHWFVSLADQLDEALAEDASDFFSFQFNPFSDILDDEDDSVDEAPHRESPG